MLIDARTIEDGSEFEYGIVVVGAGPAGIAIVDRLRGARVSIGLVESGGFDPELRTQRLYRGEVVGDPYFPLDACRYRLFGGSSNRWGGWCRPLDPIDFERRDWIPGSGWPITSVELEPFYADAARLLESRRPTSRSPAGHAGCRRRCRSRARTSSTQSSNTARRRTSPNVTASGSLPRPTSRLSCTQM